MSARVDNPTRAAGAVAVLGVLVAAAIVIADGPPAPDPLVDRASYSAGVRHALDHQAAPGPSGFNAGPDGTRADCQVWIDQARRGLDRDDFLAGCSDVAVRR